MSKVIYRPKSKIDKDKITIYGAGKFGAEKLVLNEAEACILLLQFTKLKLKQTS